MSEGNRKRGSWTKQNEIEMKTSVAKPFRICHQHHKLHPAAQDDYAAFFFFLRINFIFLSFISSMRNIRNRQMNKENQRVYLTVRQWNGATIIM